MSELEQKFTVDLLQSIAEGESVTPQKKLHRDVEKFGGVSCIKEILRKEQYSDGFELLQKAGKLEFSAEYLVTDQAFATLFTDEEVNACFQTLCDGGHFSYGAVKK